MLVFLLYLKKEKDTKFQIHPRLHSNFRTELPSHCKTCNAELSNLWTFRSYRLKQKRNTASCSEKRTTLEIISLQKTDKKYEREESQQSACERRQEEQPIWKSQSCLRRHYSEKFLKGDLKLLIPGEVRKLGVRVKFIPYDIISTLRVEKLKLRIFNAFLRVDL